MRQFLLQYRKDFLAYFSNYNAYILLGGYYILSFFFTLYFGDYFLRESEIINSFLSSQPIILMLVLPAITMRSWADEIKSGTIELLLTQPISYSKLVLAKFSAAFSFFLLLVASSLPFLFITGMFSVLDKSATLSGYIGLILCGALFTAVGCLISCFNRNSILSYISTIFAIFFISQIRLGTFHLSGSIVSLDCLSFENNYASFLSGIIYASNIIYFVAGVILCLWLNTVAIFYKKVVNTKEKKLFLIFITLILFIFSFCTLGFDLLFNQAFDVTDNHKFTLTPQSIDYLTSTDKRIDITLYESQNNREEASSNYAVYAGFIERFLQMLEKNSKGAVRSEVIRVEPFSSQERELLRQKIPYKEDAQGNKVFMAADFSDNEGHSASIHAFNALRQNLLEADIMRVLERFGLEKQKVILIAPNYISNQLRGLKSILQEFYDVVIIDKMVEYIPQNYSAVIIFSPTDYSTEDFLALEQYVLHGGNLVIFDEPVRANAQNLQSFLLNFGIKPLSGKNLTMQINNSILEAGPSYPAEGSQWSGIRSVLVNGVGEVDVFAGEGYEVRPLLTFNGKNIAMTSSGKFMSNYLYLIENAPSMLASSAKKGSITFFYDTDIFKDYLYVSEETEGDNFYEIIPLADNFLFALQLLNCVTGESIEQSLDYRHYAVNTSSIGHLLLSHTQKRYEEQTKQLQLQYEEYMQKKKNIESLLTTQAFASVRNVGDIGAVAKNIEETENELGKIRFLISQDYQMVITAFTCIIIFGIPVILLVLMIIIISIGRRLKNKQIQEIMRNAQTN